jgi:hypothetical protein
LARGTTDERGYGKAHQRERRRLAALVRSGRATCARCGVAIGPEDEPCLRCGRIKCGGTTNWDLGHDDDRTIYRGVEHSCCNRRAQKTRRQRHYWSRDWLPPGFDR